MIVGAVFCCDSSRHSLLLNMLLKSYYISAEAYECALQWRKLFLLRHSFIMAINHFLYFAWSALIGDCSRFQF